MGDKIFQGGPNISVNCGLGGPNIMGSKYSIIQTMICESYVCENLGEN